MRTLAEYTAVLSPLMRILAKETRFRCRPGLNEVFARHPRLVIAINHGGPLSWLPAVALLAAHANARGGAKRVPLGVMDHLFFQLPMVREFAQLVTQTDRPLSFPELAERFEERGDIDLVLFPEGSNCFFGHPDRMQDFRSPKFVELAIRTGAPILLGAHWGSENWAKAVAVEESWFDHFDLLPKLAVDFLQNRMRKTGLIALPRLPRPMKRFELQCELYHPVLRLEDLSTDPVQRRTQLVEEANKIHTRMSGMRQELANGFAQLTQSTSKPLAPAEL